MGCTRLKIRPYHPNQVVANYNRAYQSALSRHCKVRFVARASTGDDNRKHGVWT